MNMCNSGIVTITHHKVFGTIFCRAVNGAYVLKCMHLGTDKGDLREEPRKKSRKNDCCFLVKAEKLIFFVVVHTPRLPMRI